MKNKDLIHNFFYNLFCAFGAQTISLFLSIITALILPKILGVEEFAYWQLFIFYSGYVGVLSLGIGDGIYLKFGGSDYKYLPVIEVRSVYNSLLIFLFAISIFSLIATDIVSISSERKTIIVLTIIYAVIYNLATCLGFLRQATNDTYVYSFSVILDRVVFLILLIILLVKKVVVFLPYIICYLIGKLISLLYCLYKNKDILLVKGAKFKESIGCTIQIMKIGIPLMASNMIGSLMLGVGRFIIDAKWGITAFGVVSFSMSLCNFFLLFISQTSMVLFPTLRSIDEERISSYFKFTSYALGIVLPVAYVLYLPLEYSLNIWLPQYGSSLRYMIIFLPLIIFDGKMNMIYSTLLKVYRKEKLLLGINCVSVMLSVFLSSISAYFFNSFNMVIISIVITVVFRSLYAEMYVSRIVECRLFSFSLGEILISALSVITLWCCSKTIGFILIVFFYGIWFLLNWAHSCETIKMIKALK